MTEALERLSAVAAAAQIEAGTLTALQLTEAYLARIALRDDAVQAWAFFDPALARMQARALDAGSRRGLLHGLSVGIKDIIDSADQPSGYGSPIYAGHRPAWDGSATALSRAAGAVIMGKTVTTEFANRHPGATRNPHDPARTPGGSSSGSAAAVADFQVPLAVGTQTGGSVIRPAAFCGVVGFKPSFQHFGNAGVKTNTEAFDTVGIMARDVGDIALYRAAMMEIPYAPPRPGDITAPRIGIARTPAWDKAAPETQQAIETAAAKLRQAGAVVQDFPLPPMFDGLQQAHKTVGAFEGARNMADEMRRSPDQLSQSMRDDKLSLGATVTLAQFHAAQQLLDQCRRWADDAMAGADALLTPSAPGESPLGLDWTGDPVFNFIWTGLYMPCITLPAGAGPNGAPLGVQLVGRRHEDERLLTLAAWAAPVVQA